MEPSADGVFNTFGTFLVLVALAVIGTVSSIGTSAPGAEDRTLFVATPNFAIVAGVPVGVTLVKKLSVSLPPGVPFLMDNAYLSLIWTAHEPLSGVKVMEPPADRGHLTPGTDSLALRNIFAPLSHGRKHPVKVK